MGEDDTDRIDVGELLEGLTSGDRRSLLAAVTGSGGVREADEAQLTPEAVGEVRERFMAETLADDYEAVGRLLTLALLSKADLTLEELDEPVEDLEFELEARLEPVYRPDLEEYCVRICIVNGIYDRPLCWQTCIVNGILDH